VNLQVELAPRGKRPLVLANPVMTASGTFSFGLESAQAFDLGRLGAIVCKSVSRRPRKGNRQPRMVETPAGMLNSIGLQNPGVRVLIRELAPVWATWTVPVIVSIVGESIEDFASLAESLEAVPGVSGLELNISCPNVAGGLDFGRDPQAAAALTAAVRQRTTLPILTKLTPNVGDIVEVATAVAAAGADAISLINTFVGMAIDVKRRRPVLSTVSGGLSGPAIKPLALAMVYAVAQEVAIPIVGIGGIATAEDALEFILAGATAVEVGTATFRNPRAPFEVLEGIQAFMRQEGVEELAQLRGAALPASLRGRRSSVSIP